MIENLKKDDAIAFAIGLRYSQTSVMEGMAEPNTYWVLGDLLDRVEAMMTGTHPNERVIMVFDSQEDKKGKERAR